LVVAVLGLQLPFAFGYYVLNRVQREEAALKLLKLGEADYGRRPDAAANIIQGLPDIPAPPLPWGQQFARQLAVEQYLYPVTSVTLRGRTLTENDVQRLRDLPGLQVCRFADTSIDATAELPFTQLPNLVVVGFSRVAVSDALLQSLGRLNNLQYLRLFDAHLQCDFLEPLCKARALRTLQVSHVQGPNAEWVSLLKLQSLQVLEIHTCAQIDHVLAFLPPNVENLSVVIGYWSTDDMRRQTPHTALSHLDMGTTIVPLNAICDLSSDFPELTSLELDGRTFDRAGMNELKQRILRRKYRRA
jgi:hypothetical protein